MKKLICLIAFIILGCKPDKIELDSIQIMSYNYEPDYSTQHLVPNPIIYSFINISGKSMTLRRINHNNKEAIGYLSSIEQELIKEINLDLKLKNENYFTWIDTSVIDIYDGPIIRIKTSYTNGKEISFTFHERKYNSHSKFYIYKNLYDSIIKYDKHVLLDSTKLKLLKIKQNNFAKYAHHKDSLLLPIPNIFPPAPNLNEVKFVKSIKN